MRLARLFGVASCVCCAAVTLAGQSGAVNGEWRTYGGDLGHTRYSPLDQINAANFNKLEVAWRFKTDSLGPRPEFQLEGDAADGRTALLYSTAGTRRAVVALDAATGELRWMHSEIEGAARRQRAAAIFRPRPRLLDRRRATRESSTSRQATVWSRSTRRPVRLFQGSAPTALSTSRKTTIRRSI